MQRSRWIIMRSMSAISAMPAIPAMLVTLAMLVMTAGTSADVGPEWEEDQLPDAGELPGQEQVVGKVGGGPLGAIKGQLDGAVGFGLGPGGSLITGPGDFQDVYRILITDPALFSASTVVAGVTFNTQLFLFDFEGGFFGGIIANDNASGATTGSTLLPAATDGSGAVVTVPGRYLLAISGRDSDPLAFGLEIFDMPAGSTEISGPDGPAGGSVAFADWDADGESGEYRIILTGCALIPLTPDCRGDVNLDGVVDFLDLLIILAKWGPCAACVADIDGDFMIDFDDLLVVLANWGPCPP